MNQEGERWQELIERGQMPGDTEDARAYHIVFQALRKDPDFHVPVNFADRLISIIEKREEKRVYAWMATGITLLVMAMILALALTNVRWSLGVFSFLSGYPGLTVFGISFILFLHWLDKRLIRRHEMQ